MKRPGDRLRSLAGRFFSAASMERLIDPVVADMQAEDAEAVRHGIAWRCLVRLVTHASFWRAVAAYLSGRLAAVIYEGVAVDDWAIGRVVYLLPQALMARIDEAELNQNSFSQEARLARLSLHLRLAMALAPVIFGLLGLGLLERWHRVPPPRSIGLVAFLAYVAYYLGPDFPQAVGDGRVSPIAVAWAPNVVAFVIALVIFTAASRRFPNSPIPRLPNS